MPCTGGREASKGATQIPFGTDEHLALWTKGAQRFVAALKEKELLDRALALHVDWATHYDTGDKLEVPSWMMRPGETNDIYSRHFGALADLGLAAIRLPKELARTSTTHRWGPSPFHFQDSAYKLLAKQIVAGTLCRH